MSRRIKIIAVLISVTVPLVAFSYGLVINYRVLGRETAWSFVIGLLRGTQARELRSSTFDRTPARLERGRYLVSVARCFSCHSPTDPKTDLPIPGITGEGTIRQLMFPVTYP